MKHIFWGFIFSFVLLAACDKSRVYEINKPIEGNQWKAKDSLVFDFAITDAKQTYNLLYNLRYAKDYPYYNLYVKHVLCDSTGKELNSKLMNMDVFDAKSGHPLGSGMGDVFDYSLLFLPNYTFPYAGKYKLVAKQYMRDEPLNGIETFGLRIEKAAAK